MKHIESDKLGAKSERCLFVWYPKETRGYYFYNLSEQKVFVSKLAAFLEKEFLKESSGSKIELHQVQFYSHFFPLETPFLGKLQTPFVPMGCRSNIL